MRGLGLYIAIGIGLWFLLRKSGVSATGSATVGPVNPNPLVNATLNAPDGSVDPVANALAKPNPGLHGMFGENLDPSGTSGSAGDLSSLQLQPAPTGMDAPMPGHDPNALGLW